MSGTNGNLIALPDTTRVIDAIWRKKAVAGRLRNVDLISNSDFAVLIESRDTNFTTAVQLHMNSYS